MAGNGGHVVLVAGETYTADPKNGLPQIELMVITTAGTITSMTSVKGNDLLANLKSQESVADFQGLPLPFEEGDLLNQIVIPGGSTAVVILYKTKIPGT